MMFLRQHDFDSHVFPNLDFLFYSFRKKEMDFLQELFTEH